MRYIVSANPHSEGFIPQMRNLRLCFEAELWSPGQIMSAILLVTSAIINLSLRDKYIAS